MGFNRIVKLIVANKGGQAIEVSNLRTTFTIGKTSDSDPNTAEISVYNMNSLSTSFLQQNDLIMWLYCGYESSRDDLKLVFSGEVIDTMSSKSGPDKLITLICGDANKGININHYEKTYAANTAIKTIIKDVANGMGVLVSDKNITAIPEDRFINSYVALGSTKDILNELFKKLKLEWYVDDNVFYASDRVNINVTNSILISEKTGMISSPVKKKEKDATASTTESGITFNSILNPELKIGETVKIESEYADIDTSGLFVIKQIEMNGDTHSSAWYSKCLCLGEKTSA